MFPSGNTHAFQTLVLASIAAVGVLAAGGAQEGMFSGGDQYERGEEQGEQSLHA